MQPFDDDPILDDMSKIRFANIGTIKMNHTVSTGIPHMHIAVRADTFSLHN